MKVVILGCTAGMGRAISRQLIERGDQLFLLGHEAEDLSRSAADLAARANQGGSVAGQAHCDLGDCATFAPALDAATEALGGRIDCVVVTAAIFATQEKLEADRELTRRLLTIDFAHTVVFCEEVRERLLAQQGAGTLCVFSSVAGDRGRKPVALYGSAKAGLSHYLESLDHTWRAQGLRVITVKPGFVKTGMTAGLKPPPFAGTADGVARRVVRALHPAPPVLYAPWPWRWVMLVIRLLPRFVMRKVGF